MKKLIGTVAVAALIASAAFAEISLGSWLRVIAAPIAGDGDSIVSGMVNSWGGSNAKDGKGARFARVDFNGTSEDEKVGFSMSVFNDSWGITGGDNYVIWAKPWDFLKVSFGRWDYTTFRGDLSYGSWGWIRPINWIFDDEGLTFDQLGAKCGMQLEITPVEGLVIMWNLPIGTHSDAWGAAYKMLQAGDIAAKYTIGDIGTIKAGWGGQEWGDDDWRNYGAVNVAFDLTAVEKLYVTVGAKINIASTDYKEKLCYDAITDKYEDSDPAYAPLNKASFPFIKVALGASYQILDNLGIAASFGLQTYQIETGSDVTVKHKPDFQFGVGVNFGITDTLTLNADFRGLIRGNYESGDESLDSADPQFSFLLGLQYSISSNGYVGIGFQGSTGGCGFLNGGWQDDTMKAYKDTSFCWAVPLVISCWF